MRSIASAMSYSWIGLLSRAIAASTSRGHGPDVGERVGDRLGVAQMEAEPGDPSPISAATALARSASRPVMITSAPRSR